MPVEKPVTKAEAIANAKLEPFIALELADQGFPAYMTYSFIETAVTTDTVILSRLPGGVGQDLISEGYDLKGFHIKAKSCNWGPMAGFICQLPVFNKQGIAKADYNTKEVLHYLKHLDDFNGAKANIEAAKAKRDDSLHNPTLDPVAVKRECDAEIVRILKEARGREQRTGEWSGENELNRTLMPDLPFIPLRRKFDDLKQVSDMRGVEKAIKLKDGLFYGIAYNVTDENDKSKNDPTVITEFLLDRKADGIWDIYHGRVKYTGDRKGPKFADNFTSESRNTILPEKLRNAPKNYLDRIFSFSTEVFNLLPLYLEHIQKDGKSDEYERYFPALTEDVVFKKVRGFVNPFPPFPSGQTPDIFYKNAVSGDYDLFAMWPSKMVNPDDLIRQSEIVSASRTRTGGKVFTTYLGPKCNFAIEFIPGFKYLNPAGAGDILKESAEYGNMNSLCHTISSVLNSTSAHLINSFNNIKSTANKGFHSDEGGRPGIMEIEFPIAVFLPKKITSVALNNEYDVYEDDAGVVHDGDIKAIEGRESIDTYAGLIKSPEELLLFIFECMNNNFRVYMHYRWMIHLLYNTILKTDVKSAITGYLTADVVSRIQIIDPDFKFVPDLYLKDFREIDKNQAIIDKKFTTNLANYDRMLARLLSDGKDNTRKIIDHLLPLMISYAYLSDVPPLEKKAEFEALINNTPKA
jgi:hypothetical protein